ncbi:MAG: bifunctional homocysteine S-methyltransferase/methylenetetrahydrofolate reductase [Candidatus Kapaibacterium sp.]
MSKLSFAERLGADSPLVTDGSVAYELSRRGFHELPADVFNLKNPVLVEHIYRDFLQAGAELLKTNTLLSNRIALEKYGLSDKVYEINRKGVWIARTVALHKGYVAGVVGPTGRFFKPIGTLTPEDARQVFIEQIIALLDGGAEVLMLKSFVDSDELEIAIDAAKFVNQDVPIIALKAFPEDGSVLATSFPADCARRMSERNVAAIGASSTVGPNRMLDIIRSMTVTSSPLCSLPDIAIPTLIDGRANYNAEPEYVASVAKKIIESGVTIIGADGGASIEHIRAIAEVAKTSVIGGNRVAVKTPKVVPTFENPPDERSNFAKNIGSKFMTTVEVEIPRGLEMSGVIAAAQFLKDSGIDAVNVFDGARARVRISPIAISHILQSTVGIECITHLACRDRNMVGLQSDLIGAYSLGLRNPLAVTGDPTSIGDYPNSTSVYDVDSIGLIRAIKRMNQGMDLMGNPLGKPTQFLITCACNPAADDLDREISRLEQKAAEGAEVVFSQPVFELNTLEHFLRRTEHLGLKFMLGIIPLRTARHAEFLHYEVPGMVVPEWVRRKMNQTTGVEQSMEQGMKIAVEFLREAKPMISGVYIMPPAKKYQMAVEMLGLI